MAKNKLKILFIAFFTLVIFLIVGGHLFYLKISSFVKEPFNPLAAEKVFPIKPGQSLAVIAQNLKTESIISNKTFFKLFTKYKKAEKKLQAGEYILSASQSPEQILEIFLKGKVKLYRITIPEGMNINEIALLVEKESFCRKEEFTGLCHDTSFILSLGIKAVTLEGYLFPDTYFFPKNTDCKSVITTMVEHFNTIFTKEWQARAKTMGFSVHDIVTLASIIEKETGDAQERPLISSVFHNRLKKDMRLESDPTVIYGIKNFDGNIKKIHLKMKTPYNTYQIKGLPFGPIANPGAKSLEAALNPVLSDYLFFVSKKDTTHQFSKTVQEHNQAVAKYQLGKK
ncbi:MAG: endolytic transglycosylase MltG [Deltaproteobacteria bacterium]|uniref:endolytic transglycosylase MltG n=1 Tax=Desulfobacula sp. TaxID=2593537 RepID=UPI0019BD6B22|nr:endolytic transglycosylase MltG [Candidatus Desulfobacula maris]MBL6996077.1 endolytic transglycosylase MltG [Desulfobacula sp.]